MLAAHRAGRRCFFRDKRINDVEWQLRSLTAWVHDALDSRASSDSGSVASLSSIPKSSERLSQSRDLALFCRCAQRYIDAVDVTFLSARPPLRASFPAAEFAAMFG